MVDGSDTPDEAYSWISIALHWVSAIGIITMLFIGISIAGPEYANTLRLHTSIGVTFYLIFWARVLRRILNGHPRQKWDFSQITAVTTHYAILASLAGMLLTGPVLAWTKGPIEVFDLFRLPAPKFVSESWYVFLHRAHEIFAILLSVLLGVHLLGTLKHIVFDRDGTLDRILLSRENAKKR